jgi:nucleotide-binding universal stress UspA family protein
MLKRLLVASDLSSRSDIATRRAFMLAKQHRASVLLLHVVDDDQPRRLLREEVQGARRFLDDYYGQHDGERAFRLDIRVEPGASFEVIARIAEAEDVDLVVMGSYRKRLLLDVLVGTTLERVVRSSRRPVLMVNLPPRRRYRRVLAAVDLSDAAREALEAALRLGFLEGASVSAVHAFAPPGGTRMSLGGVDPMVVEDYVEEYAASQKRLLHEYLRAPALGGIEIAAYVENDVPFAAIERVAGRVAAELLVIGTRGLGGVKRLVLGSVTEEVLRRVNCDVLAVPPRAAA